MLRASRSYVCWRCASRGANNNVGLGRLSLAPMTSNASARRQRQPATPRRAFATVQHPAGYHDAAAERPGSPSLKGGAGKFIPIRERLREWVDENPDRAVAMLVDMAYAGELSNSITRPQNVTMAQFDVGSSLFEGDELSDLRSEDAMLRPGDLVELSSEGSRRPMLAVCLGRFNGYDHFYTNSGKWFSALGITTLFVVNRFIDPAKLAPIIAELPPGDVPMEALNALQDIGHAPSRVAGAPLLKKMLDFTQDSESVYQANAGTLDASSSFIGDPVKHRYLTLHEIADLLLPFSLKQEGKFNSAALYAVHRALLQDEVFFRPLKQTGHRRSYLFEISPLSEVRIVQRIELLVRDYLETPHQRREKRAPSLMEFLKTARAVIDQSREVRRYSPHGIIGPSNLPTRAAPEWTSTDVEILQFIELWAGHQKFPNYSRLQCLGSAILRALDRYQDATLNPSTGWTLLQEVGWIPPWEIPSRYNIRFPGVEIKRGGSFTRPFDGVLDRHLKPDIFGKDRKRWDGVTAYCIDSESTVDIDDAVSVERTSDPEQSWIHVHVADPASSIHAETPIAKYAELVPETIYLQGHFARMLPSNIGIDNFSLAPGKPCLTFSALVSDHGTVLDYKITPGILQDVVYMTGDDVNDALGESRHNPLASDQELLVGPAAESKPAERHITRPDELKTEGKEELALLSRLGKALQSERLKKGATPFFQARAEAQVAFDEVTQAETENGFINVVGDPSIRVSFSNQTGTDIVENTMRLAGEVAARWCNARGIPIPYRTQPQAAQNAARIQQYTQDVFYPLLEAGIRPDDSQWRQLRVLLGGSEVSATPGPHFTMGVDMYTKATSPLRRFSDLIVHWQIEATILEEKKRGQSLVGNTDDSFLPFSREKLDRMLPMLRVREKQARLLANNSGADQWILQALVRAWKFGEATLPATFQYTVAHVAGKKNMIGRLNWFDRPAYMRAEAMNGVCKMGDVRVGDVFEVKLKDVNVHANTIDVEAVRILESAETRKNATLAVGGDNAVEPRITTA